MISTSISGTFFRRVLYFYCSLESPRELLKILMLSPYSRTTDPRTEGARWYERAAGAGRRSLSSSSFAAEAKPWFGQSSKGAPTSGTITSTISLFSPTPCLLPGIRLPPRSLSTHQSPLRGRPTYEKCYVTSSASFRSIPTTEWFISWARAAFVILLSLSILISPLPFLSYYCFQHCHFFCPSGQSGVNAALGTSKFSNKATG